MRITSSRLSTPVTHTKSVRITRPQQDVLPVEEGCGVRRDQAGDRVLARPSARDDPQFPNPALWWLAVGDGAEECACCV
jgi:hypothetical protein